MKKLFKNTALFGGSEFALLFVALIRNKYLAIHIGTRGFGIVSLLQSFFNYANLVAGSWLSTATLKYISEYNSKNEKDKVNLIFNVTFYIVFVISTFISILLLLFYPTIKKVFLSKEILFWYYAFFTASFWGTSMTNIFRIYLQSMMDIKSIVKIRIISQILNLILILLLIFLFKLLGLFINIAFISLFTAFMFYLSIKKRIKIKRFKFNWFKQKETKKIFSFSLVDVFLGFVDQTANYLKRILILNSLNMSSLGLFSASMGIRKYIGLISASSLIHFKPQMSQALTVEKRNKALNDYFRLMLFIGGFASAFIISFSNNIIYLLYSKEFTKLGSVLYIFIIAQFLMSISNGFMFTVVGMAKLKIHAVAILVSTPFAILIPYFLLNKFDLIAIGMGTIFTLLIRIIIYSVFLKIKYNLKMNLSNFLLLTNIVIILILSNFYFLHKGLKIKFFFIFTLLMILFLILKKNERKVILSFILDKVNKSK